jgi:GR25 family glycosyltransferase involved in LPS biosynthesis
MNEKLPTLGFDKIYVINLKKRLDRKNQLIKDFPNIDFTFIEAIDGDELDLDILIKNKIINTSFYDPAGILTMGVFACALSHKKAWDQALEDGVENALFLEDDVFLIDSCIKNKTYTPLYKSITNEIKELDWDIVHLGKQKEFNTGIHVGKHLVIPRKGSNFNGAHSYIVKKETIKFLSNNILPIKYAADVYLDQISNSLNNFTLKTSLFRQYSDIGDATYSDSDTYFNEYRKGGGNVGISFDQEGNVLNKKIVQYIKHPKDLLYGYSEMVLGPPKFGKQLLTSPDTSNLSLFSITDLLKILEQNLEANSKMVEINSHLGETTFFFGCSGLFSNIYAIDPLKGEDKFNIDNNITWEDIKTGFHCNTYLYKNINHIQHHPEDVVDSFNDISFLYINNRKKENITNLIKLYSSVLKPTAYIGGSNIEDKILGSTVFKDGSWLSKIETTYL